MSSRVDQIKMVQGHDTMQPFIDRHGKASTKLTLRFDEMKRKPRHSNEIKLNYENQVDPHRRKNKKTTELGKTR